MDKINGVTYDLYRDIRERTGGEIYLGVVGPVRSGKSTFTNVLWICGIALYERCIRQRTYH